MDWQIDSSLLIQWIAWCIAVLSWWSHLSGWSRLCVCSERERKRRWKRRWRRKEKREMRRRKREKEEETCKRRDNTREFTLLSIELLFQLARLLHFHEQTSTLRCFPACCLPWNFFHSSWSLDIWSQIPGSLFASLRYSSERSVAGHVWCRVEVNWQRAEPEVQGAWVVIDPGAYFAQQTPHGRVGSQGHARPGCDLSSRDQGDKRRRKDWRQRSHCLFMIFVWKSGAQFWIPRATWSLPSQTCRGDVYDQWNFHVTHVS